MIGYFSAAASAHLTRAYALSGPQEARALYQDLAEHYDFWVCGSLGYQAAERSADLLVAELARRSEPVRILDFACGTGLAGARISQHRRGDQIVGIDISSAMLARARAHGLYDGLVQADVTLPLPFPDASFDAVLAAGVFTRGHVSAGPLLDILRVLRPLGWFAGSVHREVFCSGGFRAALESMSRNGSIADLKLMPAPLFRCEDDCGRYTIFRKA